MSSSWDAATAQPKAPGTVTLGVAVAVPDPFAGRLQECRRAAGDPLADLVPPHITLVPPITVEQQQLPAVHAHLRACADDVGAFRLRLDGTDSFRPVSDVVFVNVVEGAGDCTELQGLLRGGPLTRELQFPYHPHVTVAHDVSSAALDIAEEELAGFRADFDVEHVSLYHCGADGVWVRVLDVPLAAERRP